VIVKEGGGIRQNTKPLAVSKLKKINKQTKENYGFMPNA
jgi:hypothetical protein